MAFGSHFDMTEIVLGAVSLLAVAVIANSYFDLGVGFLYDIENMVVSRDDSTYGEDLSIDYSSASTNCKKLIKVFGENKRVIRKRIRDAETEGNEQEAEALRSQLEDMKVSIKSQCM